MNGYFVTGTDTDVGKTHVACALVRRAVALGHKVFAFKPVETGCAAVPTVLVGAAQDRGTTISTAPTPGRPLDTAGPGALAGATQGPGELIGVARGSGEFIGADQELLAIAAGNWQRGPLRGLYRFPLPAAPFVAAQQVGSEIDLALVERTARQGAQDATITIVEGAGGWRVPITAEADMGTMAKALGLPVLVVSRARLGTINHTLLTLEAIERDGLQVAAVVFSQRAEDDSTAAQSNLREVQRRWKGQALILQADPAVLDDLLLLRST